MKSTKKRERTKFNKCNKKTTDFIDCGGQKNIKIK